MVNRVGHRKNKPTFGYRVISRVVQQFLRPLNCNRAFARYQIGHLEAGIDGCCLAFVDLADKAYRQGLLGVEEARRQADILDPTEAAYCLG